MNMETSFADWLQQVLDERDMSQTDLANAAGVGTGSISDVISGRRKVGKDLATKIARGLRLPPEIVFQKAGILPASHPHSEEVEQIIHEAEEMTRDEQLELLSYIRWWTNRKKK